MLREEEAAKDLSNCIRRVGNSVEAVDAGDELAEHVRGDDVKVACRNGRGESDGSDFGKKFDVVLHGEVVGCGVIATFDDDFVVVAGGVVVALVEKVHERLHSLGVVFDEVDLASVTLLYLWLVEFFDRKERSCLYQLTLKGPLQTLSKKLDMSSRRNEWTRYSLSPQRSLMSGSTLFRTLNCVSKVFLVQAGLEVEVGRVCDGEGLL